MNGVMLYILQRTSQSSEGTFGVLHAPDGSLLCHTAELNWDNNNPDTSCIPAAMYNVVPHNSADHPNTWELQNVPNRTGILIHNGNLPLQSSKGCICVGMTQGWLGTQMAVLSSMQALNMLRKTLPQNFSLSILDVSDLYS